MNPNLFPFSLQNLIAAYVHSLVLELTVSGKICCSLLMSIISVVVATSSVSLWCLRHNERAIPTVATKKNGTSITVVVGFGEKSNNFCGKGRKTTLFFLFFSLFFLNRWYARKRITHPVETKFEKENERRERRRSKQGKQVGGKKSNVLNHNNPTGVANCCN